MRHSSRLSGMPIPTPAKSWWLHVPLSFTGRPFRKKPFAASDRVGDVQPDVTVDPAALVPPALMLLGIDADGQDISSSEPDEAADVVPEAGVAARMVAQLLTVEPDRALAVNAVEVDPHALAPV